MDVEYITPPFNHSVILHSIFGGVITIPVGVWVIPLEAGRIGVMNTISTTVPMEPG